MELVLPVLAILMTAGIAPLLTRWLGNKTGYWLALLPLLLFSLFFMMIPEIGRGEVKTWSISWVPALKINFSFFLDGLSLLFALLVTGMGTLVMLFSAYYMKSYQLRGRFFVYILLFMGAMLGLVLANNLITMFLFWELTSVSSFLLIGFFHEKPEARAASLQALLITVFGGLALLAAIVMIGMVAGSYELTDILSSSELLKSSHLYFPIILTIFLAAFTKSAQFPFHFWLPGAMQAPGPVSAYLHSATMVKAGIYLLARLTPVLGNTPVWQATLMLAGAITMIVGSFLALTQTDLKKILAYTTVSALGILVLLVGLGTDLAFKAAVIFIVVHSFYKGSLFMIAGALEKTLGTRDIRQMGGLWKIMPVTTVATILTLLSMAGLPPFLGFIGKEIIYDAKVQAPDVANLILILVVIANSLMVAVATIIGYALFFGKKKETPNTPHEPSWPLLAGPVFLAVASMVMGIFPNLLASPILSPAVSAIKAETVTLNIKLWHGFNLVLLLSILTVSLGLLLFLYRKKIVPVFIKINQRFFNVEFSKVFSGVIDRFLSMAKNQTEIIQHGRHRYYLMLILLTTAILGWSQLFNYGFSVIQIDLERVPFYMFAIVLLIIAATMSAVISNSRLVALVSLGVIGFLLSLIFMLYGAVDVAITLIITETLIVILFMMIIYHLPPYMVNISKPKSRIRDAMIALIFGGFMTTIVLKAESFRLGEPISNFFLEKSFTEAHGRNIVNVILVDFRGLDTFGEAIVLVVAAIGVFSLLKLNPKRRVR